MKEEPAATQQQPAVQNNPPADDAEGAEQSDGEGSESSVLSRVHQRGDYPLSPPASPDAKTAASPPAPDAPPAAASPAAAHSQVQFEKLTLVEQHNAKELEEAFTQIRDAEVRNMTSKEMWELGQTVQE